MDPVITMGEAGAAAPAAAGSMMPAASSVVAGAAFLNAYAANQMSKASAINQQTAYLTQARDTLAIAEVKADASNQYAMLQAGRTLLRSEMEALNYKIAGNTLLKNLRRTNAAMRARAAANGVAFGEGSMLALQGENTAATMRDVGIADLNALTAQVLGFEDATAMLQSTEFQNYLSTFAAQRQAGGLEMAAATTRRYGGLMADMNLTAAALQLYRTT
jgi:hypothetical protein